MNDSASLDLAPRHVDAWPPSRLAAFLLYLTIILSLNVAVLEQVVLLLAGTKSNKVVTTGLCC